jgi:DNA-binding transcriptional ArsR family regulator
MARAGTRTGGCKTCAHPERGRIDWLCAAGASVTSVAAQFGLSHDSVSRHLASHVSDQFKRAAKVGHMASEAELAEACVESGRSVLDHLRSGVTILNAQRAIAHEAGGSNAVVAISRELREHLGLIGKITREYLPGGAVTNVNNVLIQMNFVSELGRDLIPALADMPEAQRRVIDVLERRMALPAPEGALEHAA